jgi:DNA-binding MarR family transcriptional regulator
MTTAPTAADRDLCLRMRAMCACDRLRRSARAMTQLYDAGMGAGGLKVTQLPILVALAIGGEQPLSALAAALGVERTTLTRNLKPLEQRGLVRTASRQDDARVRIVALTRAGDDELAAALARWEHVQARVEERFGAGRLRALYAELEALSAAVAR